MRPDRPPQDARRRLALAAIALAPAALAGLPGRGTRLPETVAGLRLAHQREMDAHRRYVEFAAKATTDGYQGIAYLFSAFAASEGVHARNFQECLGTLGVATEAGPTAIVVGTTKENLIRAANDESDSIEKFYPETLRRLEPEGCTDALTRVRFAWGSERQHRDIIARLRRYSPMLFETVARRIDEKTGIYFVCGVCGSTLNKAPALACPVCASESARYRRVPLPG